MGLQCVVCLICFIEIAFASDDDFNKEIVVDYAKSTITSTEVAETTTATSVKLINDSRIETEVIATQGKSGNKTSVAVDTANNTKKNESANQKRIEETDHTTKNKTEENNQNNNKSSIVVTYLMRRGSTAQFDNSKNAPVEVVNYRRNESIKLDHGTAAAVLLINTTTTVESTSSNSTEANEVTIRRESDNSLSSVVTPAYDTHKRAKDNSNVTSVKTENNIWLTLENLVSGMVKAAVDSANHIWTKTVNLSKIFLTETVKLSNVTHTIAVDSARNIWGVLLKSARSTLLHVDRINNNTEINKIINATKSFNNSVAMASESESYDDAKVEADLC